MRPPNVLEFNTGPSPNVEFHKPLLEEILLSWKYREDKNPSRTTKMSSQGNVFVHSCDAAPLDSNSFRCLIRWCWPGMRDGAVP